MKLSSNCFAAFLLINNAEMAIIQIRLPDDF